MIPADLNAVWDLLASLDALPAVIEVPQHPDLLAELVASETARCRLLRALLAEQRQETVDKPGPRAQIIPMPSTKPTPRRVMVHRFGTGR